MNVFTYYLHVFSLSTLSKILSPLVKHLMIKISERNFTLRFDDSMSSFSSENKINTRKTIYLNLSPLHA